MPLCRPARSCHLQGSKGGIERTKALIPGFIRLAPARIDVAHVANMDAARDRFVHICERADFHAGEEGGAVRGAFLDNRSLEGKAEHGSEDSHPELAARASSRDATGGGVHTELAQELERVA